jgi:hypothetical protein
MKNKNEKEAHESFSKIIILKPSQPNLFLKKKNQ